MNRRKIMRGILWAVFVIYACVVLGILFLGGRNDRFLYQSVWEYIRNSVNLIPFKTIWDYAVDVAVKPWMLGIATCLEISFCFIRWECACRACSRGYEH